MKVAVFTSDKHLFYIQGMMRQMAKYWPDSGPVDIVGFTLPEFKLLPQFNFISMGNFTDYPVERWSNAFLGYLQQIKDEFVTVFLEDYWLIRNVPPGLLSMVEKVMYHLPQVVRFDLTSDRLYAGKDRVVEAGCLGCFDIIRSLQSDYQFSLQAGVWRRDALIRIVEPNKSPWEVEHEGTGYFADHPEDWILGTRQWPVRYQIMVRAGQLEKNGDWMYPTRELSSVDVAELKRLSYLPKDF